MIHARPFGRWADVHDSWVRSPSTSSSALVSQSQPRKIHKAQFSLAFEGLTFSKGIRV